METTHRKPHAVCIPIPGQGHINPMLKLAKLLHSSGFHITFVYTEFHYRKVLSSENNHHPDDSVNDFRFETISDGLPPENERGILDLEQWCIVMPKKGLVSFRDLIVKLNGRASSGPEVPPVTCIVSDILLSFTLEVAQEFGIPETLLATPSACATLGYLHFHELTGRGYFPLKEISSLMETTHQKPHAVCIPVPAQGHINPMLNLAKLLHSSGFHITFVHTQFNFHKLLSSKPNADHSMNKDFHFEAITDGLPPENERGVVEIPDICADISKLLLPSFRDLILKLNAKATAPSNNNNNVPPPRVTCIVSDILLSFTMDVAEEFGIPAMLFASPSATVALGNLHSQELKDRGYFPLKDEECLTNGYLDTVIDWIPGMSGVRLRDFPFIKSTNPDDIMFNYNLQAAKKSFKAEAILLNSLHDLEQEVIDAIKAKYSPKNVFTIGPLSMLQKQLCSGSHLDSISSSLWKEDTRCLEWLDNKEPKSVVYVNYGSLVIMTPEQLGEFAWGLANSKYHFLWIIRPNLVKNWSEIITDEYMEEIKERSMLASWCPQEKVLEHPSIGVFLTHCGWNSTLESITEGVPMLCWPFFTDQQMNCFFACRKWGVGLEIDEDVRREKVEKLLQDVMEGEAGHQMRKKAGELKEKARIATRPNGISYTEFEKLVQHLKEPNSVVGSL